MRFMVLVYTGFQGYEAGEMPEATLFEDMNKFNEELIDAGVMLGGDGLQPSAKGARIHFPGGGKQIVTQGPFKDLSTLVAGYWIWNVKSQEEALAWAKRAPMEDGATLELRQIFEAEDFGPEVEAREKELQEKLAAQKFPSA